MGMRNPWRFCFDKQTGLLYAADVGEATWEEVDIIEKGKNYGWSLREGKHDFKPNPKGIKTTDPIFEYHHDVTAASITGGLVYRGKAIPALYGFYIFGDYTDGRVFALKYENGKVTQTGLLIDPKDPTRQGGSKQKPTQPAAFGEDSAGEPYLVEHNGVIYKIELEP
jgi:quinoprotein glucose dehydrogenase